MKNSIHISLICLLCTACETRPGLKAHATDPNYIGIRSEAARTGHEDTFVVADLDTPLRQLKFVNPNYPAHLSAKKRMGSATISFTITETGDVANVKITEASHPDFGESAASAIAQWKFSVPTLKGKAVSIQAIQKVPFGQLR